MRKKKIKTIHDGRRSIAKRTRAERVVLARRVRRMILEGKNTKYIRTRFNLTAPQYNALYKRICQELEQENGYLAKKNLLYRMKQHEHAAELSLDSFRKSQRDAVEITKHVKKVPCRSCDNGLDDDGRGCVRCGGKGYVKDITVIDKRKGQVGDVGFLKEFRENLKCIERLEGLCMPKEVNHTVRGQIAHVHEGVPLTEDNRFKDAPPELILEMMSVLAKVEDAKRTRSITNESDDDIVDVDIIENDD